MEYIPLFDGVQKQIFSMLLNTVPYYVETVTYFGCSQQSGHQHNVLK